MFLMYKNTTRVYVKHSLQNDSTKKLIPFSGFNEKLRQNLKKEQIHS